MQANKKGTDQTARMRRLISAFVSRMQQSQVAQSKLDGSNFISHFSLAGSAEPF